MKAVLLLQYSSFTCLQWASAAELLRLHAAGDISLAPPQVYELARLTHFPDLDELRLFAGQRQRLGTSLFYPVIFCASDGVIFVYPGDDLYPERPDFVGDAHDSQVHVALSVAQLRDKCGRHNRAERLRDGILRPVCTVDKVDGHRCPVLQAKHRL